MMRTISFLQWNVAPAWRRTRGWLASGLVATALGVAMPVGAAMNAAYVSGYDANLKAKLTAISTTSNAVIGTLALPEGSSGGAAVASADGNRVYVTGNGIGVIGIVDTSSATMAALGEYVVGERPTAMALYGKWLYVTDIFDNTLRIIDTTVPPTNPPSANAVVATIPVGTLPYSVDVSPDGARVYVANQGDEKVSVINTTTRTVTATWTLTDNGEVYDILSVDTPVGERIYVTDEVNDEVHIFDKTGTEILPTLKLPNREITALAVSPTDNRKLYVLGADMTTGNQGVWAIDTITNTVTTPTFDSFSPGTNHDAASVSSDGKYLYTADIATDRVAIYDLATGAIATPTTGGVETPLGLGFGKFTTPLAAPKAADRAVSVNKTLAGDTTLYISGTFDVTVTCATASQTFNFVPGGTMSGMMMVPEGELCTVSENTGSAVVNGTSRKTIVPYLFTVGSTGQVVSVENELIAGPPMGLATVSVTKEVMGAVTLGHDPAAVFGITVSCPGTSSLVKSLSLGAGQSGLTDAVVGDTCAIAEPMVPPANTNYKYAPSIIPATLSVPATGRTAKVVNNVVPVGTAMHNVTFTKTVNDLPGSGYLVGALLNTTVTCGGATYPLNLAESDQAIVSLPNGAICTAVTAGALPTLTSPFYFSAPTASPGLPHAILSPETITINYSILKGGGSGGQVAPIPALDMRALLLLIGLMAGLALWQRRNGHRSRFDMEA